MPTKASNKFIFSCTIGTFLEFFDYTLYGYFAGTIGNLFFPHETPALQLIAAWGIFSIGFLIRPLGALLIGSLADKKGRRKVLPFTIVFMAIPTALIGILPTFAMAGWLAPILLLLCRLMQGIAMSAEYNGASIYILENNWRRPGFLGSLTPFAGGMGMLAASFLAYSFTHNLEGELSQWYWRLAFIIAGLLVGFVGWYLRRSMHETAYFQELQISKQVLAHPLKKMLKNNKLPLITNIFASAFMGSAAYLLLVYMATFLHEQYGLTISTALWWTSLAVVVESFSTLVFGWLSDYVGRWQTLVFSSLFMAIVAFLFIKQPDLSVSQLIGYLMVFSTLLGAFDGPLTMFLPELFKTETRYSSTTIGYNLGGAALGGLAPFIISIALQFIPKPQLVLGVYLGLFAILASAVVALYALIPQDQHPPLQNVSS